jgi:glycosyltransferase involved in cell wall biosynthesis
MKKYLIVTNIPTPYRVSLFDDLQRFGLNIEVLYMRSIEEDRHWLCEPSLFNHNYTIDKSLYKMIGNYHFHFNPRILMQLINDKEAVIIAGGSWADVNIILLAILKRIGVVKNALYFWSEANFLTLGAKRQSILKYILRKYVFNSSDEALIVPGRMAEITFSKWGVKNRKFIRLPNVIEEEKFNINQAEILTREKNELPIFLLPARLNEKIKGIINFIDSIGHANVRKIRIYIAGDGPDRYLIEHYIRENNLFDHIVLLGHCDSTQLNALYKKANVFVLPSFSDPSPLTVVEAACMHLPLLISESCGNHYEILTKNINGYTFDPYSFNSIKSAFESILARKSDWPDMGLISARNYAMNFGKLKVIKSFIHSLDTF